MELSIDVETYSDCPIKYGAQRYVDDTTFEILLFAYSFDDEPVEVIDIHYPKGWWTLCITRKLQRPHSTQHLKCCA